MAHHPDACRRCHTLQPGEDPEPLRHRVIEIPPITPLVIEHRLHRLACPCSSTSTLLRSPTIGVGLVRLGVSPSVQITAALGPAEHVKQRRQLQGQQGRHQRQRM